MIGRVVVQFGSTNERSEAVLSFTSDLDALRRATVRSKHKR